MNNAIRNVFLSLFLRTNFFGHRFAPVLSASHLKNRILVQDRGGAEFKTAGILLYVEDFKRGSNKDIGPKDIFELGSNQIIP
jgi:hypothetical protein